MKITALVLTSGRADYIKENVNSLIKFDSDIFVVVNGFSEDIVSFLGVTKKIYPKLDFFVIDQKVPKCVARNIGVDKTDTDVIYFLDDDTYIDTDIIKIAESKFKTYREVSILGGPNLTPPNSSDFENMSGVILSTPLMSWKMCRRYLKFGQDRITDDSELILCNLAIKKDLFTTYNLYFNEKLHYNEENLLIEQLKSFDVQMMYSPELYVYHHRRSDISSYTEQVFNSGKGRAIMTVIMPSTFKIIHTLPVLFLFYIIAAIINKVPFVTIYIYLLLILFNCVNSTLTNEISFKKFHLMIAISLVSHISYAAGYITGTFQGLIWRIKGII